MNYDLQTSTQKLQIKQHKPY